MRTIGVDVSHWEGAIDWTVAARWVPFAYFKCTDGIGLFDNTYQANKRGCQETGLPYAPYHYFEPADDPEAQAVEFVTKAGEHNGQYIADFEEPAKGASASGPGTNLPAKYLAFLQKVEQLTGKKPAIYTSAGFWNEHVNPKPAWTHEYELLVAHYTAAHAPILPIGWDKWTIWQYTDAFYFPGCQVAADGNWFNGNLSHMRAWFGNYKDETPPPAGPFQVRSLFDNLHIRQEPRVTAREIGHLLKGELVDVEQLGGDGVWVRHPRGWSAVEICGYRYMEVVKP